MTTNTAMDIHYMCFDRINSPDRTRSLDLLRLVFFSFQVNSVFCENEMKFEQRAIFNLPLDSEPNKPIDSNEPNKLIGPSVSK